MGLTAREKLAAAVIRVCEPPSGLAPYFGTILRGLVRREMDEAMQEAMTAAGMTPTLGVTANGILYWAPKFVESCDVTELALVLIHESMHVILKHSDRGAALGIPVKVATNEEELTKAQLWNHATDACINEEIRKLGNLPGACIYPETLGQAPGLIAEERYKKLLEQPPKKKKSGGGVLPNGAHEIGGGRAAGGACGGCARNPLPGEKVQGDANGPADGRSEAELERFRKMTAEAVKDHAAKKRGTVPASLERWADEYLAPPKIPWREKLARLVRGAVAYRSGCVDYTWSKMSRRQGGVGYGTGRPVVPALHAPVPSVACVLDTSGSMGETDLAAALSEVQGVLQAVGANITFVVCDARVHGIQLVKSAQEAAGMLRGGGGTAMAPALEAVAALKPMPTVTIVLTDGYIDDPPEPPFSVIWTIIGPNTEFSARYGDVVHVEKDAA